MGRAASAQLQPRCRFGGAFGLKAAGVLGGRCEGKRGFRDHQRWGVVGNTGRATASGGSSVTFDPDGGEASLYVSGGTKEEMQNHQSHSRQNSAYNNENCSLASKPVSEQKDVGKVQKGGFGTLGAGPAVPDSSIFHCVIDLRRN